MKWIIFGITFITWHYIFCQDVVFPNDEELSHLSGNDAEVTERLPVYVLDRCPENMLLYPGSGNKSSWICDCRPRFLYFPLNDSCHEAYKQGPCAPHNYVVLHKTAGVPHCVQNPCHKDGLVEYNGICHPLRTVGGPCGPYKVLGVNEITFQLECIPIDIAPFIVIQPPKRQCPMGSRRNSLGICRQIIK